MKDGSRNGGLSRRQVLRTGGLVASGAVLGAAGQAALGGTQTGPKTNETLVRVPQTVRNPPSGPEGTSRLYADDVDIPDARTADFEEALRFVVGAKYGRNWEEFCDDTDNVLDVRDYGARMDGTTDDGRAISRAMDDAAESGGCVFVPEGELRYREAIEITPDHNGITIVGDGVNSVLKRRWRESEGEYGGGGIYINDTSDSLSDVTLANFRINGGGHPGHGVNSRLIAGENIRIDNVWIEQFEFAGGLLNISDLYASNVTVRNNGGHGLALNNGVLKRDFEDWRKILSADPNWTIVENFHAYNNGQNDAGGAQGIDVSTGANIAVNKFISELNVRGMKTPHTNDARVYNGLIKDNPAREFMINDDLRTEVSLNNIKVIHNDSRGSNPGAVYITGSYVNIGLLVIENAANGNWYSKDSESQGDSSARIPKIDADTIISFNSAKEGLLIGGTELRVKNLISLENGQDIVSNGGGITVENLAAESVDGEITIDSVVSPTIPPMPSP